MAVFSQEGDFLGALPPEAVKFNSVGGPQSSLIMLSGKYVDADGIVYDADGTINESATAAWARDATTQRTQSVYNIPDPAGVRHDSVQENSQADQSRTYVDAMLDNATATAHEIPGLVVDAGRKAAGGAWTLTKLIAVGFGVVVALEVLGKTGYTKRYRENVSKRIRHHRRRIARVAHKYIAG